MKVNIKMMPKGDSNILVRVEELLGILPSSIEEGRHLLKEYLIDIDEGQYSDVDDIETLIEIVSIMKDEHITTIDNPFKRKGRLLPVDEWDGLKDFSKLRELAIKNNWEVLERKFYYSFVINGRIFFKMEAVRKVNDDVHSGKLIFPRIDDNSHVHLLLDTYDLLEFKDREWKVVKDVKLNDSFAEGRYFLMEEVEKFIIEIASRI